MVRGVNRQVLEITETNNMYYEKALLVVRPEYANAQQAVLEREAKSMIKRMRPPSAIKIKSKVFYWTTRLGLASLLGAGAASLIFFLCL